MKHRSPKFWRFGFLGGIILLNVMLFFRAYAFLKGGWHQLLWSLSVVGVGGVMLYCIFMLRELKEEDRPSPFPPPEPPAPPKPDKSSSSKRRKKKKKRR